MIQKTTGIETKQEEKRAELKDIVYESKADNIVTEQEKMLGQRFDFSI